jgi:hypothetical protein
MHHLAKNDFLMRHDRLDSQLNYFICKITRYAKDRNMVPYTHPNQYLGMKM